MDSATELVGNLLERAFEFSQEVRFFTYELSERYEEINLLYSISETLGFQVSGPGGSVLYVPDTDGWEGWEEPVEKLIRSVDVALLDATFYDEEELPGRDIAAIAHPLVVDSLARFGNLEDSERAKIRFTHLNHSNPLLDPFSDEATRVVRAGMAVATEGDVYPL